MRVEFTSPLLDIGAAMAVRSSSGNSIATGATEVDGRSVRIAVDPSAAPGRYDVAYRVVAEDGHAIQSTFSYSVAGEPSSPPVASTGAEPGDSGSLLPGVVGGIALALTLAVIGAIALRR